jgi:hypothetical protein
MPFVGQKVPQGYEQERAEAAALGSGPGDAMGRQQSRQKLLGAILGLMVGPALSTDKCIEGMN